MIQISSRHPFKYTWQYKHRLRENVLVNAPQLIIRDLKKLYLYHLKRLIRVAPDMVHLLSAFENSRILGYDPFEFSHPDCDTCTRHWRYTRGCLKNKFRCKNVKAAYEQWKIDETNRIRKPLKDVPNVIEIACKGYSYFMVPTKPEEMVISYTIQI